MKVLNDDSISSVVKTTLDINQHTREQKLIFKKEKLQRKKWAHSQIATK
jgi:hypothetical protein